MDRVKQPTLKEKKEQRVCAACVRLRSNPDFIMFMDGLMEDLFDQRDLNDELEEHALYKGIGEAQRLKKILNMVDSSADSMAKIRLRESKRSQENKKQHGAH